MHVVANGTIEPTAVMVFGFLVARVVHLSAGLAIAVDRYQVDRFETPVTAVVQI